MAMQLEATAETDTEDGSEEDVAFVPPQSNERDSYLAELTAMTVHELRSYARSFKGLAIYGREISMANKEQLLDELMKAKFRD